MALLIFGIFSVNTTKLEMHRVGRFVSHLWGIAAIFLFVMIGAISNLDLFLQVGLIGLVIILIGVLARILGAFIALNLTKSDLHKKEKLFVGLSTLGKATVQATLGPLVIAPLASLVIEFTYRKLLVQTAPPDM